VKTGHRLAIGRIFSLDDGGDENGESDGEHADGLALDPFHSISRDFSILEMRHDQRKAE
jgi:hypothetical protein